MAGSRPPGGRSIIATVAEIEVLTAQSARAATDYCLPASLSVSARDNRVRTPQGPL